MYKVSIIVLCAAFSACLFSACRSGLQSDENSLVQVGDEILSRQELADAMPEGLSRADSTDFADKQETSASGTETSSAVQRPNPMTAVTDETAFQSLGVYMALPEEAEDPLPGTNMSSIVKP